MCCCKYNNRQYYTFLSQHIFDPSVSVNGGFHLITLGFLIFLRFCTFIFPDEGLWLHKPKIRNLIFSLAEFYKFLNNNIWCILWTIVAYLSSRTTSFMCTFQADMLVNVTMHVCMSLCTYGWNSSRYVFICNEKITHISYQHISGS